MAADHFDVLIVGAGLSGIGAAHHLQRNCPNKSYVILEGREVLGGTWDLFRYPGIRSDSDMYTLGYSFRPWTNPKAIADGPAILSYLQDTAREAGIDKHIRFKHRVVRVEWSSATSRWTVEVRIGDATETTQITASFVFVCAGYYDYDAGYTPDLPNMKSFRGRIVHPQHWTDDIDYDNKRVVVIGSGATAVTLVPALAKKASHVTMLQRSPTYIMSLPESDPIANFLREKLPTPAAYAVTRWKNVLLSMAFYNYCRKFPGAAKGLLIKQVKKALRGGSNVDAHEHFTPTYDPWDQRLCLVPDGDLFRVLRDGSASIVTDHIESFTETGIRLKSGKELEADLIVTATGLQLKFIGGLDVIVDGKRPESTNTLVYKGMMLSDVPNFAFAIGYTNASWTLKCDLTSEYVCRLINHMDRKHLRQCTPRRRKAMKEIPLLDFTSGYVQRALDRMPRQGEFAPWRLHQNYALDLMLLRHGKIDDPSMEFRS